MNELKPTGTGGGINLRICLFRIVLAVIAIISLVLVVISNVYVFPALKSAELWQMAALCDVLLALSAAAFVASLTWKRSQIRTQKVRRRCFRAAIFLGLIGILPYWVLWIPLMRVTYPPFAMFFSPKELQRYYGRCMEIKRGQTVQDVLVIMAEFRISSQTSNALTFNTERFSADLCYVQFTEDTVPRVKSVEFYLD